MIICNNCGAEYEDDLDRCPYCGGDNFGKSVQVHEDTIHDLEREKKQWEAMPKKVAGKGMSFTAKLGILAILIVIIICAVTFVHSFVERKVNYQQEQKYLTKLESLYQSGDYEGIYQYMKKIDDSFRSYYDKYRNVSDMQRHIDYLQEDDEDMLRWMVENDKPDALTNMNNLVVVLNDCQEAEDAYYKYEEQEAVAYYRQYCYDYLQEYYDISEDELNACIEEAGGMTYDSRVEIAEKLQKLALDHLKKKLG